MDQKVFTSVFRKLNYHKFFQKNPPDLIVTKNLKKKHHGAVDKLTKELKQLLHSGKTSKKKP